MQSPSERGTAVALLVDLGCGRERPARGKRLLLLFLVSTRGEGGLAGEQQ